MALGMALAAVAGGILGLAGCTSVIYDSNPEGTTAQLEDEPDFASHTVQNLLAECVGWAVENYPPPDEGGEAWFAINLPRGLTREQYIAVAQRVGERAAPITPELAYLPTYHIGWVWMRGDNARVDVFRPVYMFSRGDEVVYQTITLHLHRRWASWRVERTQPWEPGVVALPPVYYLPPEEVEPGAELEPGAEVEPEAVPEAVPEEVPQGSGSQESVTLEGSTVVRDGAEEGDGE
jgi:hypothetical protein